MLHFYRIAFAIVYFTAGSVLFGVSAGTNATDLDNALKEVNVVSVGGTITFDMGNVTLDNQVRAVQSDATFTFLPNTSIIINGMGHDLNGLSANNRGLFVGGRASDGTGSVTINNLNFVNCRAKGGDGGTQFGGGGLGAGGGLFVGQNTDVILQDCIFSNCSAEGGNGNTLSRITGGGGGGMRGDGGGGEFIFGGGGGGGFGGNGEGNAGGGGGASGFADGNASGRHGGKNFDGTGTSGQSGMGGDGPLVGTAGLDGGFGGGGGASLFDAAGGLGGFGGGGGGGGSSIDGTTGGNGASGGFGGGGGGGGSGFDNGESGGGGFGAGGGGGPGGSGASIFGGGNGTETSGGRGAGLGGAIFIQDDGKLTLKTTANFNQPMFSGNSAKAGETGNANTDPNAGFGALGQDIFMMSSGLLTFDLASPVSIPTPIQSNLAAVPGGGLTKKGAALLTLTGDNTYTGKTIVEEGELHIEGSTLSELEVQAGAILSGNFTAKNIVSNPNSGTLTNSGIVAPGQGGYGTVNLEGSYIQTNDGKLIADITPTGVVRNKILGANNATLEGTLEVVINPGNYLAGKTYTIVDAPTGISKFDTVIKTGSFADLVDIDLTYGSLTLTLLNNVIFAHQNIKSGAPKAVANCIVAQEPIPSNSDFALVVEKLGLLDTGEVNKALTAISAVNYGAMEWLNARNNSYIAQLLSEHTLTLCCSKRNSQCSSYSSWIDLYGMTGENTRQFNNLSPFDTESYGGMIGLDRDFDSSFYLGGAFGYTYTHLEWKENLGEGDVNTFFGALYGSWQWGCVQLDTSLLGGRSKHSLTRDIAFKGLYRTAKSHPWMSFLTLHLGAQGKFYWCFSSALEPYGYFDYHYLHQNHFSETGSQSIGLSVESKNQHMLRAEVGARAYWEYSGEEGFCYAPYLGLGVAIDSPFHRSLQRASFKDTTCVMKTSSYHDALYMASPQVGIKLTQCSGLSFAFGYKGLLGSKARIHQGEGRFEWVF